MSSGKLNFYAAFLRCTYFADICYNGRASRIPFITGGFINTKNEIEAAMESGAAGITTSVPNLWFL